MFRFAFCHLIRTTTEQAWFQSPYQNTSVLLAFWIFIAMSLPRHKPTHFVLKSDQKRRPRVAAVPRNPGVANSLLRRMRNFAQFADKARSSRPTVPPGLKQLNICSDLDVRAQSEADKQKPFNRSLGRAVSAEPCKFLGVSECLKVDTNYLIGSRASASASRGQMVPHSKL